MCAELFVDRSVAIAQKRIVERILELEFPLQIHRICADSHSLSAEFFELGRQVTEMTAFLRSKRGLGLWVEEEDHRAIVEKVIERYWLSRLIDRGEVAHMITCIHEVEGIARSTGLERTSTSTCAA